MGNRKGTGSEKGTVRTKKKLTLSKETIKDLAPTGQQARTVRGGRAADTGLPRTVGCTGRTCPVITV